MKVTLILIAACLAACGGDDNPNNPAKPDASPMQPPLTCKSDAICTTYEVKTFLTTLPAPAGGTIKSGLYRLAYVMIPDNVGETAGYHQELEALEIRGTSYNWAGFFRDELGTTSTSGTMLTFQATQRCSRGTPGDPSTNSQTYKYTATDGELDIYDHVKRSDGVEWDAIHVYKATTADDVCKAVASEPSSPGDSARCNVTNCACNFAIEGTVAECT